MLQYLCYSILVSYSMLLYHCRPSWNSLQDPEMQNKTPYQGPSAPSHSLLLGCLGRMQGGRTPSGPKGHQFWSWKVVITSSIPTLWNARNISYSDSEITSNSCPDHPKILESLLPTIPESSIKNYAECNLFVFLLVNILLPQL